MPAQSVQSFDCTIIIPQKLKKVNRLRRKKREKKNNDEAREKARRK